MNSSNFLHIQNLDFERISHERPESNWESCDYFVYLDSFLQSNQLSKYFDYMNQYEANLSSSGYNQLLEISRRGKTHKYYPQDFVELISILDNRMHNEFMKGQIYLQMSRYCSQESMPEYALLFSQKAQKNFDQSQVPYYSFLSDYNCYISQLKMGTAPSFRSFCRRLENLVNSLPCQARSQALFLQSVFWMYLAEYEKAVVLLCEAEIKSKSPHQKIKIYRYLIYALLKAGKVSEIQRMLSSSQHLIQDYLICQLSKFIKNEYRVISPENILEWKKNVNSLDIIMLLDLNFSSLVENEDINNAIFVFKYTKSKIVERDALLPVRNLLVYEAIFTNNNSAKKKYQLFLENSNSAQLMKEYSKWSTRILKEKKQLEINLITSEVMLNNRRHDFKKRKKSMQLLLMLSSAQEGLSIDEILAELYPDHGSSEKKYPLDSLIYRLKKYLGENLIFKNEQKLFISPSYLVSLIKPSTRRSRVLERQNLLIDFFKKNARWFSISELESNTSIQRRTLQEDLKALVANGRVERKGKGKGTLYRRQTLSKRSLA